jgi:hypothetical protein
MRGDGLGRAARWLLLIVCATSGLASAQDEVKPPSPERESTASDPPAAADSGSPPAAEAGTVDFAADVEPILTARCVKCHGAEMHAGGLRLDDRELAMRGGDSGRAVLGGSLEENELYARVSSDDRNYRMPKNAEALSTAEISVLRRWVEQGSSWPAPKKNDESESFYNRWLLYLADQVERYEPEYRYTQPYTLAFLALMCLLLVVTRCRSAYRQGRPWTTGRMAGFCRFSDGVKTREIVLIMLVALAGLSLAWARGHTLRVDHELARLTAQHTQSKSPWTGTVYGYPPKPVRPDHPKQVAGTYYRGNCERNAELFNGGNYLTATFRVSLCDSQHRQLAVGDPPPEGGLFVRVEIERAPGTTEQLFSRDLMNSVVLVKQYYEAPDNELKEKPVRLETLEADQHWVAYVPIGSPAPGSEGRLDGVIYMYTGQVMDNKLGGSLHYGVQYALVFADGELSPDSDLWMDSFGNAAFEPPRPFHKLPYQEWFDYRPIPPITGENSKDPKLLGVEQYIREGLIKPTQPDAESKEPPAAPPEPKESPPDK